MIERQAAAEAELKKRQEQAERATRELEQKLASERITHLLAQAKAFDRANQIRAYVESALLGVTDPSIAQTDVDQWAVWARRQADATDPLKNGMIAEAIRAHVQRTPLSEPPSPQ